MRYYEPCCVVDGNCEAPANLEEAITPRTRCYPCGQKVCKNCSYVLYDNFSKRKVRACNNCLEEDFERFNLDEKKFLRLINREGEYAEEKR